MFKILAALDQNEDRNKKIAEAVTESPLDTDSIHVILVTVSPKVRGDEGRTIDTKDYSDTPETVLEIQEHFQSASIETQIERKSGDAAKQILRVARQEEVDWIIVGGRKRSPVGKAVFGSVSQAVILNTDCPVLVATE